MSRDVLRTLADARPAELDPGAPVDPSIRDTELSRAMAPAAARGTGRGLVPRRRRVGPLWGGLGLGLVGATAAAALVVTSLGGGEGGVPGGDLAGTGQVDVNSARTVLLAAAEKAEAAPATGKYWRVKKMFVAPRQVGPEGRTYTVSDAKIYEEWISRDGRAWVGHRAAGAKPRTPADEKAWRRDGAPARWDMGVGDTVDKKRLYLQVKPGAGSLVKVQGEHTLQVPIAGPKPSFAALQKLPADPAVLRKMAEKSALSDGSGSPLDAENPQARQAFAAGKLADLLTTAPVPPKVRAAAFRALADMPAVRSEGRGADERGRKGVVLTITVPYAASTTSTRLIIDPATSQVLSEQVVSKIKGAAAQDAAAKGARTSGKERTTLYLGAGWTDQAPQAPTLP
ncbi:CU044_5270 family protein [Actinomadura viridis]|uniref:CU044_5270 family protein n=1 Tax=Actinomadura viridis TaxID=58110 RepID=UPI0036C85938